jgi:hypothetical protein
VPKLPREKLDPNQIVVLANNNCDYCGHASGFAPNTQEIRALLSFITTLRDIAGKMEGRNLKLRLDIKCGE